MTSEGLDHFDLEALIAAAIARRVRQDEKILAERHHLAVKKCQPLVVPSARDSVRAGIDHERRSIARKRNASINHPDKMSIISPKKAHMKHEPIAKLL